MSDSRYEVFKDPYCYRGTFVLKNKAGLRDEARLEAFELEMTTLRSHEPLPSGDFDYAHYRAVHRHIFQDVYPWAGKRRTVRTSKGGNHFCYPENIDAEMNKLFARLDGAAFSGSGPRAAFIKAASEFLGELNAIHAFREGNGRAQLAFLHLVALRAGHPLKLTQIKPEPFLQAMIASFDMDYKKLERQLTALR